MSSASSAELAALVTGAASCSGGGAEGSLAVHRALQLSAAAAVGASELAKGAVARWQSRGFGYWWVGAGGFTVGDRGCGGLVLNGAAALLTALVLLDGAVGLVRRALGRRAALAAHGSAVALVCALAAADLALSVGAGGARVSLPLVLFVLSEPLYVLTVVRPWLAYAAASGAAVLVVASVSGRLLLWLVRSAVPGHWRLSRSAKVVALGACAAWLVAQGHGADGAAADMLSQLGVDFIAMLRGSFMSAEAKAMLDAHHVVADDQLGDGGTPQQYPPLLLYHWEAGSSELLAQMAPSSSSSSNVTALPFMRQLAAREDVEVMEATVAAPVTLKTAWEVLCGVPAALTSDFREHGSALRRNCLPRVLRSCCGYYSILAKTDKELPTLPKRVFGFDEVIVAETYAELLPLLRARLSALGALPGAGGAAGGAAERPALVYFYADDAHTPYRQDRVEASELGYSENPMEDVFLALHRRADRAAEQLARFWPPARASPETPWAPEHGAAVYFGDHGEVVRPQFGWDPPPHGHLVRPEVAQVLFALESRAFSGRLRAASALPPSRAGAEDSARIAQPALRRPADIYSTVLELVGQRGEGALYVGSSLFHPPPPKRRSLATFSFYRPAELVAVRVAEASAAGSAAAGPAGDGGVRSLEFSRTFGGWTVSEGLADSVGAGVGPSAAAPADACVSLEQRQREREHLEAALQYRERVNRLMTQSNVHAAWLLSSLKAGARKAAALARSAIKTLLHAALPSGSSSSSSSSSSSASTSSSGAGADGQAPSAFGSANATDAGGQCFDRICDGGLGKASAFDNGSSSPMELPAMSASWSK